MPSDFPDHFSAVARQYARSRPTYPEALFDWLAGIAPGRRLAWDCATGSGQAAVALARHFEQVIASDASREQLSHAVTSPKVEYRTFLAEAADLEDASVDLVTVAQALHWFDRPAFYDEVRRVLVPGGVIAAWTYRAFRVEGSGEVTRIVDDFHDRIVAEFWPPERSHVETGYAEIDFPFARIHAPHFQMQENWTLDELLSYLGTWSSVSRYRAQVGEDPRDVIAPDLGRAWGDPAAARVIVWPLSLLVGTPLTGCSVV